ncbi:alpha/beta hydrolase [Desertibacillus haloalkaliphilus]|uniref:alpha/beta hydrolase n=1 Tax=Desertibacillus haloalkaliphilus TaxID=1328930 RepID=UPI001C25627D|nr:alpha/beta hydrolase [Desertibacillus haloalkaliphilus]MBU8905288.1 lysophospholipase [Desertibacillus haloalkaliphilus]
MWKWESTKADAVFVIVHGAGEHHQRYAWLIEQLNTNGCHVVTGDLPGQGKTRGKRGHISSFTQYMDTITGWYEEAASYRLPVFLLGHSMGGLAVIRTMMEKKLDVHGVILSSPCLGLVNPPSKSKDVAARVLHRVTPTLRAKSGINSALATRNEQVREAYVKDEMRVSKVSIRWYQELVKAMKIANRSTEAFPDVPLLVLQAGDDHIVDKFAVERWFNQVQLSDKSYKEWDQLYHEVFNEPERDEVFRLTKSFIELRK